MGPEKLEKGVRAGRSDLALASLSVSGGDITCERHIAELPSVPGPLGRLDSKVTSGGSGKVGIGVLKEVALWESPQ